MPTFNSFKGIWKPAREKIYVDKQLSKSAKTRREESFFHDGPDRAADDVLKAAGQDHLGMDVSRDPENIMRARQMNMTTEEFLKLNEPPTPEQLKAEEEKKNRVVDHQAPAPKQGVRPQGGGVTMGGGFGDQPA